MHLSLFAQRDSLSVKTDTIGIKKSSHHYGKVRNLFREMISNFRRKDTTEVDHANELRRNDEVYKKFEGRIIRNIIIKKIPFGIAFADTTKKFINGLTKVANELHHITKTNVIKNNLFFKQNDSIRPYLMADNERFLRQLPYLEDAIFTVVPTSADSVDVTVTVKDVFSIGGAIGSLGLKQSQVQVRDDNLAGNGDAGLVYGLYDNQRKGNLALGTEYLKRNIGGSFIDGSLGYQSFYPAFSGPKEENIYYLDFTKPLINRYMRWTYELSASYHSTRNRYTSDSIYLSNNRYKYHNIQAWAGYNLNATDFTNQQEADKLRKLIGIRFINQKFQELPIKYSSVYNWQFADLSGVLATLTFYRQNFYKTQYIYGFGRNEDIPEGLLFSVTSGYTIKQGKSRPFLGFNYEKYHFNDKKNYISFTFRGEGFLNKKSIEDINFLGDISYFDHLKAIGTRWKQRFFLDLGVAQQVNTVLNEPLFANSTYGLPEYGYNQLGGTLRATVKAESVFFSPWSVAAFRFAPFVFSNVSVFSPYLSNTKLLTAVGGGIRTRNEGFTFGTVEIKGFYFPTKNFHNSNYDIEISTNVIFKYNSQFVQKPDFIQVN
ncbi:MAG: hypothetical protein M3Z26_07265 [Bacteroidota bacterium]|nr:hypothetical protein [Bacteroidota bacterium]